MAVLTAVRDEAPYAVKERASVHADALTLRVVSAKDRTTRGTVSSGACRWFLRRGIDRIRFAISGDGRFCALEGDETGVRIMARTGRAGTRASVALQGLGASLRPGTVIALSPFGTRLVGGFPHEDLLSNREREVTDGR